MQQMQLPLGHLLHCWELDAETYLGVATLADTKDLWVVVTPNQQILTLGDFEKRRPTAGELLDYGLTDGVNCKVQEAKGVPVIRFDNGSLKYGHKVLWHPVLEERLQERIKPYAKALAFLWLQPEFSRLSAYERHVTQEGLGMEFMRARIDETQGLQKFLAEHPEHIELSKLGLV